MMDYLVSRLPTPESVRRTWLYARFGDNLMDSVFWVPGRRSLALGFGVGWCIGLLPLFGFRIALALRAGVVFRCHLPATVLGALVSNRFTLPAILALQYLGGSWICNLAGFHPVFQSHEATLAVRHALPLLVGGLSSALLAGAFGYAGVWIFLGYKEKGMVGGVV